MSLFDAFRFDGKRVLVVGGATGIGAAAAELTLDAGAEVVVMDLAPVTLDGVRSIELNLADTASIDAAVAECSGPVHALLSCAGVADGVPGIEKINFLGHRHLIDGLRAGGHLPRGSAIGMISSFAGVGWQGNLPKLHEYLDMDIDTASAWAVENGRADYMWSKMAINAYVAQEAFPLLKEGIRINAIMPGPTDTPLARANADTWLTFAEDYREATGTAQLVAEQMGDVMVFLNSQAASGISGVTLLVDAGHVMSSIAGTFEPGGPIIDFLLGRS